MSVQGDIAAALVTSLQAVTWTATADAVTVETKNFPQYDLEDHSWGAVTWPTGVTSPQTIVVEKNPGEALAERNVWRAGIVVTYRVPRSH